MFLLFLRWKEAKIKTAPARAKTPSPRLNGNELASLKQISVLIAFVQGFLNARSDEVGSFFAARRWHRLSARECAALFLSTRARFRHRLWVFHLLLYYLNMCCDCVGNLSLLKGDVVSNLFKFSILWFGFICCCCIKLFHYLYCYLLYCIFATV